MPDELEILKNLINKEINNFVVKDTYTKGKISGLRKALAFIEDIQNDRAIG